MVYSVVLVTAGAGMLHSANLSLHGAVVTHRHLDISRKGKPLGWHVEVLANSTLFDAKPVRKFRVH